MSYSEPAILGIATSVPKTRYTQDEILEKYLRLAKITDRRQRAVRTVFGLAGVDHRYSVVSDQFYATEQTTMSRNEEYMAAALPLGERAICQALDSSGYSPADIDDFTVVSCTGFSIPGLDLLLAGRLGMRADLRRTCILGMGCYGAFPGLQRVRDAASGSARLGLVLTLELCSLHMQFDGSTESAISSALFSDGAAAAIVGTPKSRTNRRQPYLVDSATRCEYNTLEHMSFTVTDHGFRMYLSSYVPDLLAGQVESFADDLLHRNNLTRQNVRFWGIHPGSSKILDFIQTRLGLDHNALDYSRDVLREYGNMSSATMLFVLDRIQECGNPQPGDYGVLMAFGPGLTMEAILIRW